MRDDFNKDGYLQGIIDEALLAKLLQSNKVCLDYGYSLEEFIGFTNIDPMSSRLCLYDERDLSACPPAIREDLLASIQKIRDMDTKHHIDMIADAKFSDGHDLIKFMFDVKDVTEYRIGTGNYTISTAARDYFRQSKDNYWLAFRLNARDRQGNPSRLDTFACVRADEKALSACNLAGAGGETCYSLARIWKNCGKKFVTGDAEDMKRFLERHGQAA